MNSSPLYASASLASASTASVSTSTASHQHREQTFSKPARLFKDRFEILRRLGRGGFSTAYLAQDITSAQPLPCVIKQIKYKKTASAQLNQAGSAKTALELERNQRRFQREARTMARLGRHAQLPCLLDHFADGDQFYLVQEYVPGLTLSQELRQHGPQNEIQVKQFLREMIAIVRYIHRQRLLHLDIKPANIIRRSSDQKLVLIDFGAVRRYPNEGIDAGRCAGTIGFAPAEQLAGEPTPASDIYALGVTCLYLLTDISPLDLATSPKGQNLRWQESVRVSPHFTRVLEKMLAPDLAHRFQTIEDLSRAMDLEAHYDDLKSCLTSEPFADEVFAKPMACRLENYVDISSHSHAQRQAGAIRRWQQRRRQFQSFTPQ
jgi:serine/threonine protein kinase